MPSWPVHLCYQHLQGRDNSISMPLIRCIFSTAQLPSSPTPLAAPTTSLELRVKCLILEQATTRFLGSTSLHFLVSGLPSSVQRLRKSSERPLSREKFVGLSGPVLFSFSLLNYFFPCSILFSPTDLVKMLLVARDFGTKPGRLWHVSGRECFFCKFIMR